MSKKIYQKQIFKKREIIQCNILNISFSKDSTIHYHVTHTRQVLFASLIDMSIHIFVYREKQF